VGQRYCYRIEIAGDATHATESHTRCEFTDWRVGFEGLGISQAESDRVLRLFDWRDTQPLDAGTEDAPALYHMNVLIEGGDPFAVEALRTMGMHVQADPIFHEELEGWEPSHAIARDCAAGGVIGPVAFAVPGTLPEADILPDGPCAPAGRWVFAVVPGNIYNEIRVRVLEQIGLGEAPGIRALVFRRIPVAAAHAPGITRHVLDYTYLGEQGFEFNATPRCYELDGLRVCETRQEIIGWIARKIVKWAVELGDAVVEKVRSAIGRIKRLIKGEVRLDLRIQLLNTDGSFGRDELMRSGWSGEPIQLEGVKVEVRQGLAAFYAHTDSQGFVSLLVAKNSDTKVCIQVENDTAELTEFLIETTICVKSLGELTDYRRETLFVRHHYLNTLAAMSDARRYLLRHAGFEMPKITVLVGGLADAMAVQARSFAPCMGRAPSMLGLIADMLPGIGQVTEFLTAVDIVLRPDDGGSRGAPVHEYGHAVMCEMLLRQGLDTFELAWTDVIQASNDQSAGSEASYLNEAFADFLTEQIVGGTNYFAAASDVYSNNGINYCIAGGRCYDENFSGRSSFRDQVARVTSILHDAFDGHPQGHGPNDGSHWTEPRGSFRLSHLGAVDSDLADETVRLFGGRLETLFDYWDARGHNLREDNFLGALADLMKAEGVSDADVCALFALHDPGASCPDFVTHRAPWLGWLDGAVGGDLLAAFAAAPAPAPDPGFAPARPAAFVEAIASTAPPPAPGEETEPQPGDETCEACSAPVVFEGVQKIQVAGLGKEERETAFAFRLGEGSFEGIDPLGHLLLGGWDARNAKGSKLRLHLADESRDALANLLAESAAALGQGGAPLRLVGPGKIELRLAKGGALVGKIAIGFEIEVDGRTRRGTYVAKLRGA